MNKVTGIEKYYNEEFAKLNNKIKHNVKLKILKEEYAKNLGKL